MSKLIINFCDTNRHFYGNKTYDHFNDDSNFEIKKWNCLSESGDNCGVRCRQYCDVSPYVVIGKKIGGQEIIGETHDELVEKINDYFELKDINF